MSKEDRCAINFCSREQGAGTWTRIRLPDGKGDVIVPVCEEHWAAVKSVPYDD